jgi:hypothetical protein
MPPRRIAPRIGRIEGIETHSDSAGETAHAELVLRRATRPREPPPHPASTKSAPAAEGRDSFVFDGILARFIDVLPCFSFVALVGVIRFVFCQDTVPSRYHRIEETGSVDPIDPNSSGQQKKSRSGGPEEQRQALPGRGRARPRTRLEPACRTPTGLRRPASTLGLGSSESRLLARVSQGDRRRRDRAGARSAGPGRSASR